MFNYFRQRIAYFRATLVRPCCEYSRFGIVILFLNILCVLFLCELHSPNSLPCDSNLPLFMRTSYLSISERIEPPHNEKTFLSAFHPLFGSPFVVSCRPGLGPTSAVQSILVQIISSIFFIRPGLPWISYSTGFAMDQFIWLDLSFAKLSSTCTTSLSIILLLLLLLSLLRSTHFLSLILLSEYVSLLRSSS